ncbi:MAG: YidC/Oxa1 family membrane protein insertase [Spirochaetaceae bacterium]|jgi:YidC/Oxa1 family membrane protein insertase|nr:YidC/Oxa1 family membrane protein insertase [Spirochaetaceae bacterium]
MADFLYTIIIFPLVQIIEFVFIFSQKVFKQTGISVIAVSVVISLLCLPLYIVAEKWQQIERDTQKRLKPKLDKIKAVFKGDEQYLILSTYYRQNRYHPLYSLRSSLGLLIQIPFFIAAYSWLSHLPMLRGAGFLFIRDLGAPDALFRLGGLTVNVLPILMTGINCAAGAVYLRGFPLRDKVQTYGMAAVFLVLLYGSPAGLVLYWTLNNVFSLVKNIVYKFKNPRRILGITAALGLLVFSAYILAFHTGDIKKRLLVAGFCWAVLLGVFFAGKLRPAVKALCLPLLDGNLDQRALFFLSAASLAILTGIAIPVTVLSSSPQEFSFIDSQASPFGFIAFNLTMALGTFVLWPGLIFFLLKKRAQALLCLAFYGLTVLAAINVFVFSGEYGTISTTFQFDTPGVLNAPARFSAINLGALLLGLLGVLAVVRVKQKSVLIAFPVILAMSLLVFSGTRAMEIQREYRRLAAIRESGGETEAHRITPVFHLSKAGPNVVIIMADRAINAFVKPIFAESARLREQFDGWTVYPDTVSFNSHTLIGVPPVWGGYEYTPLEMNRRAGLPLAEKHNQALLLLPRLFTQAGFHVTVTDPSWANHSWISDITIYREYPNVDALNTMGRYTNLWYQKNAGGERRRASEKIRAHIFRFALFKISPVPLRRVIYDDGDYWGLKKDWIDTGDNISELLIDSYAVLDFLPELTACDSPVPSALLITNDITHTSAFLQVPDYVPAEQVTHEGEGMYHTNAALYHRLGEWLDGLKAQGVYDHTRIIIVSDHGASLEEKLAIGPDHLEKYNPLLLVKDFNAHGELKTDLSFMTNADVPSLALQGIVENPVNPFTDRVLSGDAKKDGVTITTNGLHLAHYHPKNTFKIDISQWLHVHDNIFDPANWSPVEPNPKKNTD